MTSQEIRAQSLTAMSCGDAARRLLGYGMNTKEDPSGKGSPDTMHFLLTHSTEILRADTMPPQRPDPTSVGARPFSPPARRALGRDPATPQQSRGPGH